MKKTKSPSNKPLALVLGSGGARGWAHFGVLNLLEELNIRPDIITGTSIGSLIGAACACNRLEHLRKITNDLNWWKSTRLLFEVGMPRGGLIDGKEVRKLLDTLYGDLRIEDLPTPFAAVATDLQEGSPFVWHEGALTDAVRSSISIPGIFAPLIQDEHILVDGGLVNPLPIDVARQMGAATIIAVEINLKEGEPPAKEEKPSPHRLQRQLSKLDKKVLAPIREWFDQSTKPNIFDVITRSTRIGENQITRHSLLQEQPDILIQPAVGHIGTLEFFRGTEGIDAGYKAASDQIEKLRAIASERNGNHAH